MKIENIDVDSSINAVKELLRKEKNLSPALRSALEVLLVLVTLLLNHMTLNSKPSSTDPNRKKFSNKGKSHRKPGGQKGHNGTTLQPIDDPDEVSELPIDRCTLPKGPTYREVGHESRQIIELDISRFVTEYRAQVLEDGHGNRFVASFPVGV